MFVTLNQGILHHIRKQAGLNTGYSDGSVHRWLVLLPAATNRKTLALHAYGLLEVKSQPVDVL